MSYTKYPLVLVVRRGICKNRYMICKSYIQKILHILSIGQSSSIITLSFPYRISPQTYYLNKFLPNSYPKKVFLLLLAPSTPISLFFGINVVVQFSMTKTPYTPSTISLKPPWPLLYFSLKNFPPKVFHPTLPFLISPYWNQLK